MQPDKSFYRFFAKCLLKFSIMRLITLLFAISFGQLLYAQCEMFPVLNLGNDTLLCPGQTITFQLPSGYQYHSWGNGSNSSQFTVSQTDTVILSVSNETPNLVVNGNFESVTPDLQALTFTELVAPGACFQTRVNTQSLPHRI